MITNADDQATFQVIELSSPPLTEHEIDKIDRLLNAEVFETDLWTIDENGLWADLKQALGDAEAERVWDWIEGAGGVQEFMLKYAENFSELLNGQDLVESVTKPAIAKTIEHFKESGFTSEIPTDFDVERAKHEDIYQPGGKGVKVMANINPSERIGREERTFTTAIKYGNGENYNDIHNCTAAIFVNVHNELGINLNDEKGNPTMKAYKIVNPITTSFDADEKRFVVVCDSFSEMDWRVFLRRN
jgi:hypothetical protein